MITLQELKESAAEGKEQFPVGTKVIFAQLGGVWSDLNSLSGVVVAQHPDLMRTITVKIDRPHLLDDVTVWAYTPDGSLLASVHPSGLIDLDGFVGQCPDQIKYVNKGMGIVKESRKVCTHSDVRDYYSWLTVASEKLKISQNDGYNSEGYNRHQDEVEKLIRHALMYRHPHAAKTGESRYEYDEEYFTYLCPDCSFGFSVSESSININS